MLEKNKLDLYYKARKKALLYNSKNRIEFKLAPKDLMMMDNYRVRMEEKNLIRRRKKVFARLLYRFDSTEGKLRHLKENLTFRHLLSFEIHYSCNSTNLFRFWFCYC